MLRATSLLGLAIFPILTGCTTGKSPDEITKEILWQKMAEPETSDKIAKESPSTKETHYTLLGIGWVKSERSVPIASDFKEGKERTVTGYRPPLWGFFGMISSDDYQATTTTLNQSFYTMCRNRYRISPGLTIGALDLFSIRCLEFDGDSCGSTEYTKATVTRMTSKKTYIDHEGKEHPISTVLMTGDPDQ